MVTAKHTEFTITKGTENIMAQYGIRITHGEPRPSVGWIVGRDGDILLFPDKPKATAALKEMKKNETYSWNCLAEVVEFTGWQKK